MRWAPALVAQIGSAREYPEGEHDHGGTAASARPGMGRQVGSRLARLFCGQRPHGTRQLQGATTNVTSGVYLTAMCASRCISGAHEALDVNLMADEAAVRTTLGRGECPHCPGQVLVPRLKPRADELEDYGYCDCCGSWWKHWEQPPGLSRAPGAMDRGITMAPGLRTVADGKQGRHKPPAF